MRLKISFFGAALIFAYALTSSFKCGVEDLKREKNNDCSSVIANAYLGDANTDALFNKLIAKTVNKSYINDTYSSYYFYNLRENFGNNAYGSCGYVSLGMLLSFYDAYWDDSLIPNSYDVSTIFTPKKQQLADFDLVPSNTDSPGIRFESADLFNGCSAKEYLEVAKLNKDSYFQFKLFNLSENCFGSFKLDDRNGTLGLSGGQMSQLLNYYLHTYRQYSNKEAVVNIYESNNAAYMKNNAVKNIKDGKPTILVVKQPNSKKAHSVVAYDYDQINDEIYVHPGWRNEANNMAITHVSLNDLGYTEIVSEVSLNLNVKKNLGIKYRSADGGDNYTASTFVCPREIELKSGNYVDMNPTFIWKSLFSEKWETNNDHYIDLSILNSNKVCVLKITKIYGLTCTLTSTQWEKILFGTAGNKYYVLLTLNSDTYPYLNDYWCRTEFSKPDSYQDKPYIIPIEYGFDDAYPTDTATKTVFKTHTIRGFTFETRRYRVGYIHNEDIVLSPIRKGINEAFIEYNFKTALTRIDADLSHWREQSKEWLSNSNGAAAIQQFIGDEWVTVLDLLSNETNLTRDRKNKNTYKLEFDQPAYRIRFYSRYDGVATNDNNRGRICIGKLAFYESNYNLPLSGSELDYKPELWNNKITSQFLWFKKYVYQYTNCYSYALNAQINPSSNALEPMHPGQASGKKISYEDLTETNKVLDAIRGDADVLGFGFIEINANESCPDGMYKVALVIDNQYSPGDNAYYDYHWYRQNSDGTWSHKPGTNKVTNMDYSEQIIMDPRICNRNAGLGLNYNLFVGFYAVTPLNVMH